MRMQISKTASARQHRGSLAEQMRQSGQANAVMSFSDKEAAQLPPIILMHGVQDLTVPW